jgi:hypothetical protein
VPAAWLSRALTSPQARKCRLGHATRQHRVSAHYQNCDLTTSLRITVTVCTTHLAAPQRFSSRGCLDHLELGGYLRSGADQSCLSDERGQGSLVGNRKRAVDLRCKQFAAARLSGRTTRCRARTHWLSVHQMHHMYGGTSQTSGRGPAKARSPLTASAKEAWREALCRSCIHCVAGPTSALLPPSRPPRPYLIVRTGRPAHLRR